MATSGDRSWTFGRGPVRSTTGGGEDGRRSSDPVFLQKEFLVLKTVACIASIVATLTLAAPVTAAPRDARPPSSSSITLIAPSGAPSQGDTVNFAVSTTQTDKPYVNLKCYQGSALVADAWRSYFGAGLADTSIQLATPSWTAGAADCTASLTMWVNGRNKQLASTSFHVAA